MSVSISVFPRAERRRGAAGRPRRPGGGGRGRRRRAPARAAGRRCATGRGASGQPTAARSPDRAARAETCAVARSSGARADHDGPVARSSRTTAWPALSASATPPRITTSRSPWVAHSASMPRGPGGTAYLVEEVLDALAPARSPSTTTTPLAVGPAQGAGPRGDRLVGLGAQHRVDDQRLEPGVPGAAGLGGAGVDLGGGEGDLAGVAEHGGVDGRRRPAGSTTSSTCDSTTSMPSRTRSTVCPRVITPVRVRGAAPKTAAAVSPGEAASSSSAEPVDEALDAGLQDLADPGPALGGELAEPRHVGEHPRHRGGAQRRRSSAGAPRPPAHASLARPTAGTARGTVTARP